MDALPTVFVYTNLSFLLWWFAHETKCLYYSTKNKCLRLLGKQHDSDYCKPVFYPPAIIRQIFCRRAIGWFDKFEIIVFKNEDNVKRVVDSANLEEGDTANRGS